MKTAYIKITLSPELKKEMETEAKRLNISVASLLRLIFRNHQDNKKEV